MAIENSFQISYFGSVLNNKPAQLTELNDLINSRDVNGFFSFITTRSNNLSTIAKNFSLEIERNLDQLLVKDSRIAYLKRIYRKLTELSENLKIQESNARSGETLNQQTIDSPDVNVVLKQFQEDCSQALIVGFEDHDEELIMPRLWANVYLTNSRHGISFIMAALEAGARIDGLSLEELSLDAITISDLPINGQAEMMAWMYQIGILKTTIELCQDGNTYNFTRAGKLLSSFTSINPDYARKVFTALFSPSPSKADMNNNPLNSAETRLKVEHQLRIFKLARKDKKADN